MDETETDGPEKIANAETDTKPGRFVWLQGLGLLGLSLVLGRYFILEGYRSGGAHHVGKGTSFLTAGLFTFGGLFVLSYFRFLANRPKILLPALFVLALIIQGWYENFVIYHH